MKPCILLNVWRIVNDCVALYKSKSAVKILKILTALFEAYSLLNFTGTAGAVVIQIFLTVIRAISGILIIQRF